MVSDDTLRFCFHRADICPEVVGFRVISTRILLWKENVFKRASNHFYISLPYRCCE